MPVAEKRVEREFIASSEATNSSARGRKLENIGFDRPSVRNVYLYQRAMFRVVFIVVLHHTAPKTLGGGARDWTVSCRYSAWA